MTEVHAIESKEVKQIVVSICMKYPKTFKTFDPSKLLCLMSERKTKDWAKFYPVKHPWDKLDSNGKYVYILEIIRDKWRNLDAARKHMLVYHEMKHAAIGGFDKKGKQYKKTRPHDFKEFADCVAKSLKVPVKMVEWYNRSDLPDILAKKKKKVKV